MTATDVKTCSICEIRGVVRAGSVKCSCTCQFCEECFRTFHLRQYPTHKLGGTNRTDKAWAWISGNISSLTESTSRVASFEQDQVTKWFGLHVEKSSDNDRVTRLIETPRFSRLVDDSLHHAEDSPPRQFPSITSFVGETGSGKSTLIRSLIYRTIGPDSASDPEAPVPGVRSGLDSCLATTGEVNLYPDPSTFGTKHPHFLADCEGMLGGEPVAAQHQRDWFKEGRRYLLESEDGKPVDRKTAVMTIYPRFLYIFSDVICMVTRNQKTWADSAVKLLEWSRVGAHNTINQYALPAIIIVLNGPTCENATWISEDQDAVTRDFFTAIEEEISENTTLREMAKKHGDKNMMELFRRNFSSVYVHYIPLEGFRTLGNSYTIIPQIDRLAQRILKHSKEVQMQRRKTWTLFDAKELSVVFDYAFKHLAKGNNRPFDFNQCRQQMTLPVTTEGHFAEFISHCFKNGVGDVFHAVAAVMGFCIVRNSLKVQGTNMLNPSLIFNEEYKSICNRALEKFLNFNQPCAYVHSETGQKCVNTRSGHAIGHQSEGGALLAEGGFVDGTFNSAVFIGTINNTVSTVLALINENTESNRKARRSYATDRYRNLLKAIRDPSLWNMLQNPVSDPSFWNTIFREGSISENKSLCGQMIDFSCSQRTGVCFACLFGRPEYTLPCGHVICFSCIREFDQSSSSEEYPGVAIHKECLLCPPQENRKGTWPYYIEYHPDLSGIRALSLDGGGVRGIMPLTMLRRLEETMHLEIPFNELFDIMIGTSAGGLIALGLGSHGLSARECISRFITFCDTAFDHNSLTKTAGIGYVTRFFRSSIYKTKPLVDALEEMFGSRPFFGRSGNVARVAVTTIVSTDVKLLANYNWGVGTTYLDSNIDTCLAARCTSAAPSYFEPASLHGLECTDGGLQENNPIQLAVTESRNIFSNDAIFDVVLSLGCGTGEEPPDRSKWFGPGWWKALWGNFNRTMDGEAAWNKFKTNNNADQTLLDRCVRLNIKYKQGKEPGLDDTSAVKAMQKRAEFAEFYSTLDETEFGPIVGQFSGNSIDILADRLKASLYFFELKSVVQQGDVAIVKGWICCRLHPSAKHAYRTLLGDTSHFKVKGSTQELQKVGEGERLRLKVDFRQQDSQDSDPIRIDVRFEGKNFGVSISGFPVTLRKLKAYWDTK